MFSHHNIRKYTWTSPDGNTQNLIDHILIYRRRHSSVLDVRSFRAADCVTDHYLLVAKVRERQAVNIQGSHKFQMERFSGQLHSRVELPSGKRLPYPLDRRPGGPKVRSGGYRK
jgi:hypothetical protein